MSDRNGRYAPPPQVPATVWGPALRATFAAACAVRPPLTTKEWRTLTAVVTRTASFSRLEDRVTQGVLGELAGIDRRDLRRALHRLAELDVIRYEPGAGRRYSVVGLRGAAAPPLERGAAAPPLGLPDPDQSEHDRPTVRGALPPLSKGGGSAPDEQERQPPATPDDLTPTETTPGVPEGTHWRPPLRVGRASAPEPTLEQALGDPVLRAHYVGRWGTLSDEERPA